MADKKSKQGTRRKTSRRKASKASSKTGSRAKSGERTQRNGRSNGRELAPSATIKPKKKAAEPFQVLTPAGKLVGAEPGWPREKARELYRYMVLNRILDERLTRLQRQGRIGFHIWSLGEEAAIIGSAAAMEETDWIFPCYREAGAALLRGMTVRQFVHNMFGTSKDPVKGRQMPCHWYHKEGRVPSVSSPIGTQISHATGAGVAARIKGDKAAMLVYFGDGATSSNDFHMGMNFAGVYRAPVVFFCRNNQWAISVPLEGQTASASIAVKAQAYGFEGVRVDGNDLLAVYEVTRRAVQRAYEGGGPTLIEAVTYRMEGHSTSDDPRAYRPEEQVEPWRAKDPITRVQKYLKSKRWWTDREDEELRGQIDEEIAAAIKEAEETPPPSLESMFDDVYIRLPRHLEEQREELLNAPRAPKH